MSNSRNWVAQINCPYTPGSVDVSTGATPEFSGDATFAQAFGAGPIDVYWALQDASTPPRSMAGIGSLSAGSIDVSSPSSTFDGTTYDNSPAGVITLTSPVTIRCSLAGEAFDDHTHVEADITDLKSYLTQPDADAIYEPIITPKNDAFNVNFGTGAGTACEGNDGRLSDARTPTAHAASHGSGQADEITPNSIGASKVFYQATDPLVQSNYGDIWVLSP